MAPELAKKEATVEAEVDDVLIKQLLTTIVIGLGKFFDYWFIGNKSEFYFLFQREKRK